MWILKQSVAPASVPDGRLALEYPWHRVPLWELLYRPGQSTETVGDVIHVHTALPTGYHHRNNQTWTHNKQTLFTLKKK